MPNVPALGFSSPNSPGLRGPLSFFLFLLAAPLNLLGQEPPDTIPITVTVQVLDRTTSEPLQNVVVHLSDLHVHTLSDSAGQFRLTGVQPGTYRMRLTRQGYLPEEGDFRILISGSFQIALIPSEPGGDLGMGQVFGRVLERESGDPVSGALVSLAGTPHRRETNSRGYFEFLEVPAGPQVLIVEQLGRESREDRLVVLEDQGLEVEVLLSIEPIRLEGVCKSRTLRDDRFCRGISNALRVRSGYDQAGESRGYGGLQRSGFYDADGVR